MCTDQRPPSGHRHRPARGFTLVEMIVAIVVIGVGLAGLLGVLGMAVQRSADPLVRKQLLAIAEQMQEEVQLQAYAPVTSAPASGCARSTFNDVRDYDGYASVGVCAPDGSPVEGLQAYRVAVRVVPQSLPANGSAPPVTSALKIVVTVTRGSDLLTLTGWRTGGQGGEGG